MASSKSYSCEFVGFCFLEHRFHLFYTTKPGLYFVDIPVPVPLTLLSFTHHPVHLPLREQRLIWDQFPSLSSTDRRQKQTPEQRLDRKWSVGTDPHFDLNLFYVTSGKARPNEAGQQKYIMFSFYIFVKQNKNGPGWIYKDFR